MTLLMLAIVLAILAAGWVAHPVLFRRWGLVVDPIPVAVADRETRKRVALAALKDAEYDHAAGKLDEADYNEIRGRLEAEAVAALRAAKAPAGAGGGVVKHACGFRNPGGSRFCAGCGQPLH